MVAICWKALRKELRPPADGATETAVTTTVRNVLKRIIPSALFSATAFAARTSNSPLSDLGVKGGGTTSLSLPMQIAISLTLLVLLPAALMSITPFLRITIVLHFLRQALGTQATPSNQVLVGLAMFLSLLIMQ